MYQKIVEKIKISTVETGSQASEKVGLWSKVNKEDLPGSPVVKKLPFKDRGCGLDPWSGTKFPHASGQLSPHTSTREPKCRKERPYVPQLRPDGAKNR